MWRFLGSPGTVTVERSDVPQIVRLFRLRHADDVSSFFPARNAFGRARALADLISSHPLVFAVGFFAARVRRCALLLHAMVDRWMGRAQTRVAVSAIAPSEVLP